MNLAYLPGLNYLLAAKSNLQSPEQILLKPYDYQNMDFLCLLFLRPIYSYPPAFHSASLYRDQTWHRGHAVQTRLH